MSANFLTKFFERESSVNGKSSKFAFRKEPELEMKSTQETRLQTTLRQRLSQQQLRFVRLLEMNPEELRNAVETELEANPALEAEDTGLDIPSDIDRTDSSDSIRSDAKAFTFSRQSTPEDYIFSPADRGESLADYLLGQTGQFDLSENERFAVRYLIGSIDSNGYIYRDPELIRQDIEFREGIPIDKETFDRAWNIVRSLEPAGVGAQSLRDSLLLQLGRLQDNHIVKVARRVLEEQYDLFVKKHFDRLANALQVPDGDIREAVRMIRSLNPKPGSSVSDETSDAASVIIPDFIIFEEEGTMNVALNNSVPELRISRSFDEAVNALKTPQEKHRASYVVGQWREAKEFMNLLNQRRQTLLRVMSAIIKLQREYFETEDVYKLRPMIIKDVARETGFNMSVISRSTANKHVETPWGIFPLRFFFSDSVGEENGDGSEALTNRKIESEIRQIVDEEDKRHPLSDEKIRRVMSERGYEISRRTVAKYRDRLEIPVARLRKQS